MVCGGYGLLSLMLWPIPLFNILHVESSAVVATTAFFLAGSTSILMFLKGGRLSEVVRGQGLALVIPWIMLTFTLFWTPNCGYGLGVMFYLLFPGLSVLFAVTLAYALTASGRPKALRWFWGIGLLLLTLTPLYDLGLHPQFYVYNHIFGGVLGPIYDEELAIRPGLFIFRGLTVLWCVLFILIGVSKRSNTAAGRLQTLPAMAVVSIIIGLIYLFSGQLGINTTSSVLVASLGSHYSTPHFNIYYRGDDLSEADVRRIAATHEYRYHQLSNRLGAEVQEKIASYIYPDPETKAQLTGARYTNVAPVWLRRPQVHLLQSSFDRVFAHELAHVFSRPYGKPILHASLNIGIVEGWAVALEPPDGQPTPDEEVIASALHDVGGRLEDLALAETVSARLSPLGFWTGRGAVSYSTMGSFVKYLLDHYGADRLKSIYGGGSFEKVYGLSVDALAKRWENHLLRLPIMDATAGPVAVRRFSIPSLFEQQCPHHIPSYQQYYRKATAAFSVGDSLAATAQLQKALAVWPQYPQALALWASLTLADGDEQAVVSRLDTIALEKRSLLLSLRLGDAFVVSGKPDLAAIAYEAAYQRISPSSGESRSLLFLRLQLVDHPEIVRVLVSSQSSTEKAEALNGLESPGNGVVAILRALLMANDDHYAEAVFLLDSFDGLAGIKGGSRDQELNRQCDAWLTQYTYQSGQIKAAEDLAEQAASSYHRAGQFNKAAFWEDFAAKMRWLQ